MKKLIYIFMLIPLIAFSQINVIEQSNKKNVGSITQMGAPVFQCFQEGEIYTIEYYNNMNKDKLSYASFSFLDENDAFNQIYNLIIDNIDKGEANDIELHAGNGKIKLEFLKNLGTYVRFAQFDKQGEKIIASSIPMTKRQVKKLFGK